MPIEFVVTAPHTIQFREYEEPPLQPDQVRVRAVVSGIKHGTEMSLYGGDTPFKDQFFDPELRMFLPGEGKGLYPCRLGSWLVGDVIEVGSAVTQFAVGDRVHGEMPHRPTNAIAESKLFPLKPGMAPELAVFTDPTIFALSAVHDAQVKVGDDVAVFGMGALGLIAIQIARLNGARHVFAVDRIPARLALARQFGADEALDASEGDPASDHQAADRQKGRGRRNRHIGRVRGAAIGHPQRAARRHPGQRQLLQGRSQPVGPGGGVASQSPDAGG